MLHTPFVQGSPCSVKHYTNMRTPTDRQFFVRGLISSHEPRLAQKNFVVGVAKYLGGEVHYLCRCLGVMDTQCRHTQNVRHFQFPPLPDAVLCRFREQKILPKQHCAAGFNIFGVGTGGAGSALPGFNFADFPKGGASYRPAFQSVALSGGGW